MTFRNTKGEESRWQVFSTRFFVHILLLWFEKPSLNWWVKRLWSVKGENVIFVTMKKSTSCYLASTSLKSLFSPLSLWSIQYLLFFCSPRHPSTDIWVSLLVQKDYYSNVKMELMVCQMLFAQLSEKTSLKTSHVLLFGHFSETLQNCPIMFY